jgi:hypothetical protein
MDHHRSVDLLQPVVVLAESLNLVGGQGRGDLIQTLVEHDPVDEF